MCCEVPCAIETRLEVGEEIRYSRNRRINILLSWCKASRVNGNKTGKKDFLLEG